MFTVFQQHQQQHWAYRRQLLLDSWNALAASRPSSGRLVPFFGSSNLFAPYSMDRQLGELLRRHGRDVVLSMGSFGFGDSRYVLEQTLALVEAYRTRPIELLIYEITPNEMPPLSKELLPSLMRHDGRQPFVLAYDDGQLMLDRLRRVALPLRPNLEQLADLARSAPRPFPVLVLDYDSNLRQWPPTLSTFSRPVTDCDGARFVDALDAAIRAVRAARPYDAKDALGRCDAIDPETAITAYLAAKIAEMEGRVADSEALYRRARTLDLIRGRLSRDSLMPSLDAWCDELGFWFVSVPEVVRRSASHPIPGFDAFVDDVHYRPEVHLAIARAIVACLHRHGFLANDVAGASDAEILRAVGHQHTFALLQSALNLVMTPASPFNDERVAQGLAFLEQAERAGCDAAVLEEYRLKFYLLARLDEPLARALQARADRTADPVMALFAPRETADTAAPAEGVRAGIEQQIRSLLLLRFGVIVSAEHEDVELQRLGVDSLGLSELILLLEERFAVTLMDEEAAGLDHRMTCAMLRDRVAERLVQPRVRRLAYEKSVARQRALSRRAARDRHHLRLRRAPLVDASIDQWAARPLPEILAQHFRDWRDCAAMTLLPAGKTAVTSAVTLTWQDLDRLSSAFAAFWHGAGARSGDVVYLMLGHGHETVAAFVGALRLGLVPSIGNEPSPKLETPVFFETFAEVLRRSGARLVLAAPALAETLRVELARHADVRAELLSSDAARPWLDGSRPAAFPAPIVGTGAAALLQHSSGTTGARKGVALSHDAVMRHVFRYAHAIDLRKGDAVASWLPLYHDMGLVACLLLPLVTATPVTLMSPFDWVASPHLLFDLIAAQRASLAWLPNFAFHLLAERVRPEQLAACDLSSVRAFINCSEPIQQEAWERFYDRFAFYGLSRFAYGTCYAMAENTFAVAQGGITEPVFVDFVDAAALRQEGVATPRHHEDANVVPLPSSGRAIEGCRVRIVSEADPDLVLADRALGVIQIAGETTAIGYVNNEDATRRSFRDGWYATGDLGYVADGELFVLGRKDDTIIVAGQNIFPADIEEALSRHRGVRPGRVAAFGVRDHRLGTEQIVVLVEPAGEATGPDERHALKLALRSHVYDLLQVGATIVLVQPHTLRKSSSGKINRRKMKDLFIEHRLEDRMI